VRLVHREAEVSLLATQLLLAHADLALRPQATPVAPAISPRQVLRAIREEMKGTAQRRARSYHQRLKGCGASTRCQKSAKARRAWPRRKPHKPPAPPILHTLTEPQKALLNRHFDAP
jgi:hypothetical protein